MIRLIAVQRPSCTLECGGTYLVEEGVKIGAIADDCGILAAEFERQRCQTVGPGRIDGAAC